MGNAGHILVAVFSALTLCAEPKLALDPALHQFEDGLVLAPDYQFVPGETAHFSCRITGYRIVKKGDLQSVKLAWQIRMLDPSGVPIDKDQSGVFEEGVLPQDKDWIPKFLASFIVPGYAPTGTYHVMVKVKDEVAALEVNSDLPFRVRGHSVEPSETLLTRDFVFVRAEDDQVPMHPAVYHPGDKLWAKFDITGYKFGDKNVFSVEYGLAILNESGAQVFAQPDAASDSKESFYPQRYVPGVLSLSLDPNVPKSSYTLVVTVRDKIGNQTWETRQPFRVE